VIDHLVTSGQFTLDGGSWDVDNNVWIVGDATDCVVIDAAHDAEVIAARVGNRTLRAIICTHAHNDHVNAAPALARATGAPILLHPADRELWDMTHPDRAPDGALTDGQVIAAGANRLTVLHTPGHAPGACCLYSADLGVVFTGDTLFQGGPGATGRSFSSFDTIIESIRERLLVLPPRTVIHTGHGPSTTVAAETPHFRDLGKSGAEKRP
jgi:glyoxylase-like metal-dependent hydrolase (beta-lactamase superfamily II)